MVKLTPEQQTFKELFEMLYEKRDAINRTISYHMAAHAEDGHVATKGKFGIGATCVICGKDLGWWCPKSPNHICHYEYDYTKRGYLTPEGGYSCEELCKYCGNPSERK